MCLSLFTQAIVLYNNYMATDSRDKIHFDPLLQEAIHESASMKCLLPCLSSSPHPLPHSHPPPPPPHTSSFHINFYYFSSFVLTHSLHLFFSISQSIIIHHYSCDPLHLIPVLYSNEPVVYKIQELQEKKLLDKYVLPLSHTQLLLPPS